MDVPRRRSRSGTSTRDASVPRVVATNAVVVLVSAKTKEVARDGVVLVALPVTAANEVAGASLSQAITLTIH